MMLPYKMQAACKVTLNLVALLQVIACNQAMILRRAWWYYWTLSSQRWSTPPHLPCACRAALSLCGRTKATELTAACPSGALCPSLGKDSLTYQCKIILAAHLVMLQLGLCSRLPASSGSPLCARGSLSSAISLSPSTEDSPAQPGSAHMHHHHTMSISGSWHCLTLMCLMSAMVQVCRNRLCGQQGRESTCKAEHPLCQVSPFPGIRQPSLC